jgi:carbamoyl-phosphate synthase large subunit
MRSTGEVMGIAVNFPGAFDKSLSASGFALPDRGRVFISVQDDDKAQACHVARRLRNLGFEIVATGGTARALADARIETQRVNKVLEGSPHVVDEIREGRIQLVVNTTQGTKAIADSYSIRRNALLANIPYFTTLAAALAAVDALEVAYYARGQVQVRSIQEWHARSRAEV